VSVIVEGPDDASTLRCHARFVLATVAVVSCLTQASSAHTKGPVDGCWALPGKAGGSSVLRFPVLDKSMPAVRGGREDCLDEKGEGERWERREENFGGRGASLEGVPQPRGGR